MTDYDARIADVPLEHIWALKEALRIVPEPDGAERAAAIARLEARLTGKEDTMTTDQPDLFGGGGQ